MIQQNKFYKGVVSDMDESNVGPDSWVFPTQNIRLFNNDGQGFIVTSIPSNEKQLELRAGYIVIGAAVHNGVAFIVSANSANYGEAEIGCYPSPTAYDVDGSDNITLNGGTGWERVYKPLINFTGTTNPLTATDPDLFREVLKTSLFNYTPAKQLSMFTREDYDESITLFMTDFNEPIRVINTGIRIDGGLNSRYLWNDSFPNAVSLIPGHAGLMNPQIDLIQSGTTGVKCGNYVYYFRYLDENLTPTSIVAQSRACQAYKGDYNSAYTVEGQYENTSSGKSISIRLDNVDTNYKYIEVYYTRYFSDSTNNILTEEFKLGQQFLINGNDTIWIVHESNDNEETADISDIYKQTGFLRVCKDITHADNVFYGGNWKGVQRHNQYLVDFAQLIKIGANKNKIEAPVDVVSGSFHNKQYKNYKNVYDALGYFRGEIYGFTVGFVFTDGYRSLAYPMRGIDAYNLTTANINNAYSANPTIVNDKGIFRFPSRETEPLYHSDENILIMSVQFIMDEALVYLNTTVGGTWIKNNVAGIYFERTERYENLLCQGLMINNCRTLIATNQLGLSERYEYNDAVPETPYTETVGSSKYTVFYDQVSSEYPDNVRDNNAQIPLIYGRYPTMWTYGSGFTTRRMNTEKLLSVPNSYGFYSIDYIGEPEKRHNIGYIKEIGKVGKTELDVEYNASLYAPGIYKYTMKNVYEGSSYYGTAYTKKGETLDNTKYTDVPKGILPTNKINGVYISQTKDMYTMNSAAVCLIYDNSGTARHTIRDTSTCRYLAIATSNDEKASFNTAAYRVYDYNNSIVNLYKYNPLNIVGANIASVYNINEDYYQITDVQDITTLAANVYGFNGDCFTQLYFIKQLGWNDTQYAKSYAGTANTTDEFQANAGTTFYYGHGVILGLCLETTINSAMRYNTGDDTYYPKQPDASVFIRTSRELANGKEGFWFNRGYNKVLSAIAYKLYDPKLPALLTKRPTAIYYSEIHQPYSFTDNYRIINPASFKAFALRYGHINKIGFIANFLYSVQDDCINQHYIGERKILQDSDTASQEIVLGDSQMLSDNQRVLAEYGSQHQWSIVQSDNAVYGVDLKRAVIWRISAQSTSKGQVLLGAEDLISSKMNKKWLVDLRDEIFANTYSDKVNAFEDNPAFRTGIVSGYDRKYGEILFTFVQYDPVDKQKRTYKTLVYNEKLNMFVCTYTYKANGYITINDDFYSLYKNSNKIELYLHNIDNEDLSLYGTNEQSIISFIVNGILGEQNNLSSIPKQFDAIQIEVNNKEFDKVVYETKEQGATQNPFNSPALYYLEPIYHEGQWRFTIKESDTIAFGSEYQIGSQMRGEWLKVTLYYTAQAALLNSRMKLKTAKTIFKISHS